MPDSGSTYNITATNVVNEVHGGGIGFQQNFGSLDMETALRQLVQAAGPLRSRLNADDAAELDTAIDKVDRADVDEPRALLPVLKSIMGIAGMAGEAGKALLDAAAKAKDLIGL